MDFSKLKGKRVLVTGGSGFIGSHLVKAVHAIGCEIFVLTKYNSVIDNVRLAPLWDQIVPIEADLRNMDSLRQIGDIKPHYVFHFAAYNHVGDSFLHVHEAMTCNAVGTANLMEAYEGFEKFVYIATSEIYGLQSEVPFVEDMTPFPISPYAVGKYAGELYARMKHHVKNLPVAFIRPFNAFGPYQSPRAVIAEIILKCLRGETVQATEGTQTRDFNFVRNLIDGILLGAVCDAAVGTPINLGSGEEISIRELILKIHRLTKSQSKLEIGSLAYRPTEIWRMKADRTKAEQLLGWKPRVSLDDGLTQSIEWYRKFLAVFADAASPLWQLG